LNPLNIDRTELLGFSGLEQSLIGGNDGKCLPEILFQAKS
jgi:hypothetical protein